MSFSLEDPTQLPGSSKTGAVAQGKTSLELRVAATQVAVGTGVARAWSNSTGAGSGQ